MDFGFTAEQGKLRKEVHDFYIKELPEDYNGSINSINKELQTFHLNLQKKAAQKGYLTPGWPKIAGGLGLGGIEQGIVTEEYSKWGIRIPNGIGYHLAGPATLIFGTDEQKKTFIPPMARGEVVWFECFTEPNAGSDEANISTQAVQEGDYYVLNGKKVFISGIYKPDWLYTEARTANVIPKHRGLSLFLIPADLPGITYKPTLTMGSAGGTQNEITYENVRVHKKYLLGELNRGFYHAMQTFEFERAGTGGAAEAKRTLEEFVQFCKEEKRNGKPLIEDPEIRDALAKIAVETEVFRLAAWRTQWRFSEREKLGPLDYDFTGFWARKLENEHAKMMLDILGAYGQLRRGSKWAKLFGLIEQKWKTARSLHAGGTLEVSKIVLASRALGLPRYERPKPTEKK